MGIEHVELWPGVEGKILRPNHPDPVYTKLGVEIVGGMDRVSLAPQDLASIDTVVRKYGVLLFKQLTPSQQRQLSANNRRFYRWTDVPSRNNHTRVPHFDDVTNLATSFMWPQGSHPLTTTGFAGVTPALEAMWRNFPLLDRNGLDLSVLNGVEKEFDALAGGYYDERSTLKSSAVSLLCRIRSMLIAVDARAFFEQVNDDLTGVAVEVPWNYALGVYSENILHWGMRGEVRDGNIQVTSVHL